MLCFGDLVWVPFTYTLQGFFFSFSFNYYFFSYSPYFFHLNLYYVYFSRFLATNSPDLGLIECAGIVLLQILGLYIFRGFSSLSPFFSPSPSPHFSLSPFLLPGANSQKDKFRKNPNDPAVAHVKYIDTKRGTRLMISGWWGMSR